jgi:hypothetical protein
MKRLSCFLIMMTMVVFGDDRRQNTQHHQEAPRGEQPQHQRTEYHRGAPQKEQPQYRRTEYHREAPRREQPQYYREVSVGRSIQYHREVPYRTEYHRIGWYRDHQNRWVWGWIIGLTVEGTIESSIQPVRVIYY